MALTGKQRRHLRGLGHHLNVLVHIGQEGVTDGVIAATAQALHDHELVKVSIADERDARATAAALLAQQTESQIAQELGKTVLLFKQRKDKPRIKLDGEPAAKADKSKAEPTKKKPQPES